MAIAYVNSPTAFEDEGTDWSSKALAAFNCTAGNLIIVPVWFTDDTGSFTISSVTDTASNTYVAAAAKTLNSPNGKSFQLWYAKNIAGNASNVITVTPSAPRRLSLMAAQYSGLDTTSPLDQTANGKDESSATSTLTTGSFTTTQADELIFAYGWASGGAPGVAAGYTSRGFLIKLLMADKIVSSIQTGVTSTMTLGGNDYWMIQAATFKAAAGATDTLMGQACL